MGLGRIQVNRMGVVAAMALALHPVGVSSAEHGRGATLENDWLQVRVMPRTPEQVAAFYEARGFPQAAIDALRGVCFLTVGVRNKSDTVIWLELKNWRVASGASTVKRLDRAYWHERWEQLDVPRASRSTFGWTLLPEERDLQPHEPVGGNLTLASTEQRFTVEALFVTGADKRGDPIVLRFNNMRCASDERSP